MIPTRRRSPGAFSLLIAAVVAASATIAYSSALWRDTPAPGGFIEHADDTALRAKPTPADIAAFLPAQPGAFVFPAPYNTQAYRLTTATDCAGVDCVQPGRAYWQALNNSTGSDTLYAVITLAGHGGATLFSLNKTTGAVSKVGPLFDSGPLAGDTTPGYYFSATAATMLYVPESLALRRYDILAHTLTTVFDISSSEGVTAFGLGRTASHYASSVDGLVHTFAIADDTNALLGCGVYREALAQFKFIPAATSFSECAPDKSGRYILVAEGTTLRSIDLVTGAEQTLTDLPSDRRSFESGYGYVLTQDWSGPAHARMRLWFLDRPSTSPDQGQFMTYLAAGSDDETHPSHTNAIAAAPASQYACQSTVFRQDDSTVTPREGELLCYMLDGSVRSLIVAPTMVQVSGNGGASDDARLPGASLDPTGEFMLWTSNMVGSGRLDAFVVRVPDNQLTGAPSDDTNPVVTMTSPAPSATVAGPVTVGASASDDTAMVGVQFTLDGVNIGTEVVSPPYTVLWQSAAIPDGVHALRAVAYDRAGHHTVSSPTLVTVNNTLAPMTFSDIKAEWFGSTAMLVTWTTSQLADSQVQYGLSTTYGQATTLDPTLAGTHGQVVTGLTPSTIYHFRVVSRSDQGEPAQSADQTFTTPGGGSPELPRTSIDTRYALPTGGTTIPVGPGGDLQAALDAANPGDVIVLDATATFSGTFVLRNKPGSGWIYVVSSAYASLPPPGTRVSPSDSSLMPKIVGVGSETAVITDAGAHHYRFVGIQFSTSWTQTDDTNYAIINLGHDDQVASDLPHDLTFDRCYIHGTPTGNIRRGITMNSASTAVIDSYVDEVHEIGADAQALGTWDGPGPFKIVNNFLSAAGENLMFGGDEPSIPFLIPSDIEIRGNHLWKPLTWKADDPSYAGVEWTVKNLMEFKNAQRVLVEGNVFENNWLAAQNGFAILITPRGEGGTSPGAGSDITIRRNILINVGQGFNLSGEDDTGPSQRSSRVQIRDNVVHIVKGIADGRAFGITHGPVDLVINHNTVLAAAFLGVSENDPKADRFWFTNNLAQAAFGFTGTDTATGTATLEGHFTNYVFTRNAIVGSPPDDIYPSGNFFPATMADVGFVNAAAGNYALAPGSLFRNAGTDGLDIGADTAVVNAATASAMSGVRSDDAPVISGTAASSITGTSAVISWTTDIAADSRVEYGSTPAYGILLPLDSTPVTSHSVQLTGLTPGTTYHFRVSSSNTASWTTSSADATFATAAPPAISAVTTSAITASGATITWTTDHGATSQVEYGPTTAYGNATPLNATLVTSHTQNLSGLLTGTLYHYRVTSTDSLGLTATSGDFTFAIAVAPAISTVTASAVTGAGATITWTTDQGSSSLVEYGLSTNYGLTTTLDVTLLTGHSQTLGGLANGTLYHFRVASTNQFALTTASGDFTFTTVAAPVISAVNTSAVTGTTATISWTTDQASTSEVEYGPTTTYGTSTTLAPGPVTSHTQPLSGLTTGTLYHYRVRSTNLVGLETLSADATFTTVAPPAVSSVAASAITGTAATISWTTDQASTSEVEYGPTTAYGISTTLDPEFVTTHAQTLSGLSAGTAYHYRVRSTNSVGLETISSDFTFTTVAPPALSAITASAITGTSATIAWTTDQPASSLVDYGTTTAYGSATALDATLATSHTQGLTGLALGTAYHYRVRSTNVVGLETISVDFTVTTVAAPVLSSINALAITGTAATISWTTDQASTSEVEYGPTTAYGISTTLDPEFVTTHAQTLSGLSAGTTYHYRVTSTSAVDLTTTSSDATFTTVAAPLISAVNASAITGTTATISWTTDQAASSLVEYGTSTAYGTSTTLAPGPVTSHTQSLSGLTTATLYHYRVRSANSVGLETLSGDATFTTVAPPALASINASAITGTAATISWATDQASTSQVDYGQTTAYGISTTLDATSVTTHTQTLSGLSTGTTYHYRVRSTNAVGLETISSDFTFTTVAAPVISAVNASAITGSAATISWTTDQATSSQVEYGTGTAYGTLTTLAPGPVTAHSQSLSGLSAGTLYHYRVRSTNAVGLETISSDFTFTTVAAPALSSINASAITGTAATIGWTTDQPSTSEVEYGLTTTYGLSTTLDPAFVTTHEQALSGLTAGTTYHYRVRSTNAVGLETLSSDFTLTAIAPPAVSSIAVSAITGTLATITWTTDQLASSLVEYGSTTAYGITTTLNATPVTSHSQGLSGLSAGTTYHYRVTSTNAVGLTTTSSDGTFTTVAAPVISAVNASAITGTSATIGWTTDQTSTSQIDYGATTAYGISTTLDASLVTTHGQTLSGLTTGTVYHYRVRSTNSVGLETLSSDHTFTTVAPPVISAVTASAIGSATATIGWSTDQASTSQVDYGLTAGYGTSTLLDAAFVASHTQSLTGLAVGTQYHYRVVSTNATGLTTTSGDFTFATDGPLVISGVSATSITGSVATIVWSTDQPGTSLVDYGTTSAYGSATTLDTTLLTSHSRTLNGLANGTLYHYRVISTNADGETTTSDDFTFTTVAKAVISAVNASAVTPTAVAISWTTDQPASSQVEYGTSTTYGSLTTVDASLVTAHGQGLSGLAPGTLYHYRVHSRNSVGLESISGDFTFTTIGAPALSSISVTAITGTSATIGWTTDQGATSQVDYGPTTDYGNTLLDAALVTSHARGLTGLAAGTTYHYRVTSTNGFSLTTTSGDLTFTTVATPVLSAISASAITTTSATIAWTSDQPATSRVDYGTTTGYGSFTTLDAALATSHSQGLAGLTPGTTYHYRVISTNSVGLTATSADAEFTTPAPPVISVVTASNLTSTTAMISWTTDQNANSLVDYGLTTAYGSATALNATLVTSHGQGLTGLVPGTLYHYRVTSTNAQGLTTSSSDGTFTTVIADPVISDTRVTAITGSSATISWTTDQATDTQVDFGTTTAYGSSTTLDAAPVTSHSQTLSSLTPGTTYHFRVRSTNSAELIALSADGTFTTIAIPVISALNASAIAGTTATITWTTDQSANSQVEYGLTTAYGATMALDATEVTAHSQNLSGLTPGATYHYHVKSTNSVGLTATSTDATFTTVAAPTISGVGVSVVTGTAATITWTTDQAADARIEYGATTAYGSSTTLDITLATSHAQTITGLAPGTTYHYRVQSANVHGTAAVSADGILTTVAMPIVSGITATNITPTAATIAWTTDQSTDTQVEYGTTSAYGAQTPLVGALTTSHVVALSGLTAGTTYHYRVRSTNTVGLLAVSGDLTFATVAPPTISTVSAASITHTSATVLWTTNQAADSWVEYGSTASYGGATTLDPTLTSSHAVAFSGLSASATYHYRVTSRNSFGLTSVSADATFTTLDAAPDSHLTLSIVKQGTGTGTVIGPSGINCGGACSGDVTAGTPITVTAVASPGATFAGWSGACSGIQLACTVTLTAASSITATFTGTTPGDFDGDGYADLVWEHADGTLVLWRMQGSALLSSSYIVARDRTSGGTSSTGPVLTPDSRVTDLNWRIVATPDLDGNGKADLLWENTNTGELSAWIMEGAVRIRIESVTPGSVDPSWHLQAAADFNGDGSVDLLWYQTTSNQLAVWFMNGMTRIGQQMASPTTVPVDWRLVGSADFDRDGQLDLVWQNVTTGDTYLWYMDGTALRLEQAIGRFGDGWQARAVADFDLDGHPDIVWQKSTGELAAWFMNGSTVVRSMALTPGAVNPLWTIVGAR